MNAKLTAVLLTAIISGAAIADDIEGTLGGSSYGNSATGMSGTANFDNLDQDTDGYLSKDELTSKPAFKEDWANADTDGDGKLDRSEFSKFETMDNTPGTRGSDTLNTPGSGVGTTQPGYADPSPPASGAIR